MRQSLAAAAAPVSQRAVRAALALPVGTKPHAGLPRVAQRAYELAALRETALRPSCHLAWPLLAGIGFIESGHAHRHGSESPRWDGIARPAILGPVLDGGAFAAIADSDAGRYDGNRRWDRAVGPMQFLPSTWRSWGVDVDHDHVANPEDIYDAAAAAGDYLCAAGGDLSTADGVTTAVFAYNHSTDYVRAVVTAAQYYGGATPATTTALAALPSAVGTSAIPAATDAPSVPPSATSRPLPRPTRVSSPSPSPSPSPTSSPTPSASAPSAAPSPDDSGSPAPTAGQTP